jgi:hypothetical protein
MVKIPSVAQVTSADLAMAIFISNKSVLLGKAKQRKKTSRSGYRLLRN